MHRLEGENFPDERISVIFPDAGATVLPGIGPFIAAGPIIATLSAASEAVSQGIGGRLIRTHGDYHLGQILRTPAGLSSAKSKNGDFVILDFEGEPARALAERRLKQSPLKDVAGMARSFSYAAQAGLERATSTAVRSASEDTARLTTWARCWEHSVVSTFLRSYNEHMATRRELLPPQEQSQILLRAYMLEKALYEVMYELNNRPRWVSIPLAGILAL